MASESTIIDDEYCTAMGSYFEKQGKQLDQMVSDYIALIQAVRNTGIKQGDTAKAMDAYIEYAEKLRDQIGNVSDAAKDHVKHFLEKVDEADQYLF